jgi:hypothetical protein
MNINLQKVFVSALMAVRQPKVQQGKEMGKTVNTHFKQHYEIFLQELLLHITDPTKRRDGVQGYKSSNSGSNSRFMLYLGETREHS